MATVYANVTKGDKTYRLAAEEYPDGDTEGNRVVCVWQVGGPIMGGYRLERFEGGLSSESLRKLFE